MIHSFWVPAFLQNWIWFGTDKPYVPHPEETGHFGGKCAELCGEYHSEMLFNVEIDEDEFLDEIRQLPEDRRVLTKP